MVGKGRRDVDSSPLSQRNGGKPSKPPAHSTPALKKESSEDASFPLYMHLGEGRYVVVGEFHGIPSRKRRASSNSVSLPSKKRGNLLGKQPDVFDVDENAWDSDDEPELIAGPSNTQL